MRADYKGGGTAIRLEGVSALNTFPMCESVNNIRPHWKARKDLYDEFGAELADAPDQPYVMFKTILQAQITSELLDRLEVTDYRSALAYCRRRTDFKEEQEPQAHAQKRILGKTRMHAMQAEDTHKVEKPVNTKSDWRGEEVSAGEVH